MSLFGGAVGGALLGGGVGSVLGGLGGSLFGGPTQVPNFQNQVPTWSQDAPIFQGWYDKQQKLYNDQMSQLANVLNQNLTNAQTNLTTGDQGEAFREYYNKLGLLNSGAFNKGLADVFGNIEQSNEQMLGQQGVQNMNALADLNLSGMGRQLGLEDQYSNAFMQKDLAQAGLGSQYRGQNMDLIGSILGMLGNVASRRGG